MYCMDLSYRSLSIGSAIDVASVDNIFLSESNELCRALSFHRLPGKHAKATAEAILASAHEDRNMGPDHGTMTLQSHNLVSH